MIGLARRLARDVAAAAVFYTRIPLPRASSVVGADIARAGWAAPLVGAAIGLAGAAIYALAHKVGLPPLVAAGLTLASTLGLTGALHEDGFADTADGLGSRRPAPQALDIMRRSDVGPMGVAALVLLLLIQVAALAAVPRIWLAAAALVLAAVTARVAVLLATGSPAARPGGFGALVAGQTAAADRELAVALLGCAVAAAGLAAGGWPLAARGLAAMVAGLLAGWLVRLVAVRRLGGMTGDVFGAILELTATAVLVTCALAT